MPQPIFKGIVESGKLRLDNPHRYIVRLAALNGKRVEIVLRQEKKQRTNPQNAWYFGVVIEILRNHLGYNKDEMHDALKVRFASRIDPETRLVIVESTARMNTKRFSEYCENIQRWASEFLDVYIPDPNECDYQEWMEKNYGGGD